MHVRSFNIGEVTRRALDANPGAAAFGGGITQEEAKAGLIFGRPAHLRLHKTHAGDTDFYKIPHRESAFGEDMAAFVRNIGQHYPENRAVICLGDSRQSRSAAERPDFPIDWLAFHTVTPKSKLRSVLPAND
jgi:hypothetical protein